MTHWATITLTASLLVLLFGSHDAKATDNNEMLKDALEMIYRRQNELNPDEAVFLKPSHFDEPSELPQYRQARDDENAEDLTLPYEVFYSRPGPQNLEKYMDYDEEEKPISKRTVFRERIDHKYHNRPDFLFPKPEENSDDELDNELDYMSLLQEYWERYKAERKLNEQRQLAERYGLYNSEEPNSIHVKHNLYKRVPYLRPIFRKRFPVAKRSSSNFQPELAEKTDPKVERDLSHIFNDKKTEAKSKTPKKVTANYNGKKNATAKAQKMKNPVKETFVGTKTNGEFKDIKKKSVDWSNYFGLDKRGVKQARVDNNFLEIDKRSTKRLQLDGNSIDEDWLVERYKNILSKLTSDMEDETGVIDSKQRRDEAKLDAIKNKLKNIEDMIIDEAIKYTGSHEGEALDSKEVQRVKDKVMSRLAAVYSLEKMRHALTEFKKSIAEQRQNMKPMDLNAELELETELEHPAAQLSSNRFNGVPEKKNEHNKDDNNVTQSTQKSNSEGIDECQALEILQHQCSLLSNKIGEPLVQPLCMLYQVCSLCGAEDTSFGPQNVVEPPNSDLTCYYIFVGESERSCAGETTCRRRANYALNTLRDSEQPVFSNDLCLHQATCVENAMENARRRLAYSPYIMGSRAI